MTSAETRRGAFDSELSIQAASETTWRLLAPLVWTGTRGDTFAVPLGFVTDFATVPRFLHWLWLPYGAYTRAAVLHDWLLVRLGSGDLAVTSRDIDGIFRRVMQDLGVGWARRWTGWAAVRWAALFNPSRAYGRGFLRDSPRVLAISVAALPFLLPGVIGVLVSLGFARLATAFTAQRQETLRPSSRSEEERSWT